MSATSSIVRDTIPNPARPMAEGETGAHTLSGSLEELRDRAGDMYRRAKERAIEKEHKFEDYVKQHPVKSVLVAAGVGAGVGLLAGFLISRR
ncbi:MAG: glycine zipper domain-containing protein [Planctomycetota bacterium]